MKKFITSIRSAVRPSFANARSAIAANKAACRQADARFLTVAALVMASAFALAPGVAMAAPWDGAANQILAALTGGLSRTIAIIAVIVCGVMALFGKLSWDWAIKIVVGIVLIFGSAAIVDYFIASAA